MFPVNNRIFIFVSITYNKIALGFWTFYFTIMCRSCICSFPVKVSVVHSSMDAIVESF